MPYDAFTLDAKAALDVTVLGPGPLDASIGATDTDAVRFTAKHSADARLAVRGFTISGSSATSAVSCDGTSDHADLRLSEVVLRDSGSRGLFVDGCHVELVRSVVRDNAVRGIELYYATYDSEADFVLGNHGGIFLQASTGTLRHLSIAHNAAVHDAGGIVCDTGLTVEDSIVVGNSTPIATGDDAQLDPQCLVTRTALGGGSLRGLACSPRFLAPDDLHLDGTTAEAVAANRACAIDRGAPTLGALDVDGQSLAGLASDLGADESE